VLAHEKLIQAQASLLSSPFETNGSAELHASNKWEELSTA